MPTATIEITDVELGRAFKKGASLDKYVQVRRKFGISTRRALEVSLSKLSIDDYADALQQGLRHGQIIGLANDPISLRCILDLMKHSRATVDEAYEACEVFVPLTGAYAYPSMRCDYEVSHRDIVAAISRLAGAPGVNRRLFLAYTFCLKLNETQAIEAGRAGIDPALYAYATWDLDMIHEEILDRCKTAEEMHQFGREIHEMSLIETKTAMAQLRQDQGLPAV